MQNSDKILFVDDDPGILAAIERSYRKQFRMDTASSGQQALELLKTQGPYAVVVADISMPGMDGIELLAKVSELSPKTVQVMMTGSSDLETFVQAVEGKNIFRYIAKPCDRDSLRALLFESLAQYGKIAGDASPQV